MSYASLLELKQAIGRENTANDVDLQLRLDAATRWIDKECHRTFVLDAADTTRLFRASPDGSVSVPDLVSVTSIKIDTNGDRSYATTLAATDYSLEPFTEPRYQRVVLWPTSSYAFLDRLVQIVGKFGYVVNGAPPDDIKLACLMQASRLNIRRTTPLGVLQSTDLGQFTRISSSDPDVMALLKPYVRSAAQWIVV